MNGPRTSRPEHSRTVPEADRSINIEPFRQKANELPRGCQETFVLRCPIHDTLLQNSIWREVTRIPTETQIRCPIIPASIFSERSGKSLRSRKGWSAEINPGAP